MISRTLPAEGWVPKSPTFDEPVRVETVRAGACTAALRAALGIERECAPDSLRPARALSALHPRAGPEKRLLDAMLLAAPR